MKAGVIGGSGFVGEALCARLIALGHDCVAVLRPATDATGSAVRARLQALGARLAQAELGDPASMALALQGCEVVFHCAGDSRECSSPAALAWVHVAGTENVLQATRHVGARRLVIVSCADVTLVNRGRVHWREDAALGQAPMGALARTKLLGEELALQQSSATLTVTAVRPAWLWGPGERRNLPMLCAEGLAGGIRLFGSGESFFATAHVDNVVQALIAAVDAQDVGGLALHVADGEALTAREWMTRLSSALELPPPRRVPYALAYGQALWRRATRAQGLYPADVARRGQSCLLDCLRAATKLDIRPALEVEQGMLALTEWAKTVGGARGIAAMARPALTDADAARYAQLADQLS